MIWKYVGQTHPILPELFLVKCFITVVITLRLTWKTLVNRGCPQTHDPPASSFMALGPQIILLKPDRINLIFKTMGMKFVFFQPRYFLYLNCFLNTSYLCFFKNSFAIHLVICVWAGIIFYMCFMCSHLCTVKLMWRSEAMFRI